ncbi:MAG: hypothetical protein HYR49_07715 [Gammaproteobacteria bacterium]|nr:hypothetical protein [Gammaproteobacteria bacterium]
MASFTELLTASDTDLVRIFHKVTTDPNADFIVRINKVAAQMELNHSQLVCALGFNKHIRDLTDIYSTLGFRSYKLLSYRCNELFRTDTYNQLTIDNILDIYSERLEDQEILNTLRSMLEPRLEHIEAELGKNEDPAHVISYRMEVHAIYRAGIVDKDFAMRRIEQPIDRYRQMSGEIGVIVEMGLVPASNLFFSEALTPDEKKALIEAKHIDANMIKNRLQNTNIQQDERDMLESYI